MKKDRILGPICIIAALAICAVWAAYYGPELKDRFDSRKRYEEIKDMYVLEADTEAEEKETGMQPATQAASGQAEAAVPARDALEQEITRLGLHVSPEEMKCIDVDSEGLLAENDDYIGWVYMPDTPISYPVVASKDNQDYLHMDFRHAYSFPGTIFMDCRCESGVLNHHSILYGHNMIDGSMFAGLQKFTSQDYVDSHPLFWFITPEYRLLYQVFSVTVSNPYNQMHFGVDGSEFKDNGEFWDAAMQIMGDSLVNAPGMAEVGEKSYIMSLSTCTNDGSARTVVHGVLLGAYGA